MNCSLGFEWNWYRNRADAYSTSRSPFWFKSVLSSRSSTSAGVMVWWSISMFNITIVLFSPHNKILNWRHWHMLIILGYNPHGWWWRRVIARSCWEVWRTPFQVTIKLHCAVPEKAQNWFIPTPWLSPRKIIPLEIQLPWRSNISKQPVEKKQFIFTALYIFLALCTYWHSEIFDDDCTPFSFLRVQKKEYKKRAMTTLPFMLADGVELGLSVWVKYFAWLCAHEHACKTNC